MRDDLRAFALVGLGFLVMYVIGEGIVEMVKAVVQGLSQ